MINFSLLFVYLLIHNLWASPFTDEIISPHLGAYKTLDQTNGNCPQKLMLMAMCTLDQLDLKLTSNPNFTYLTFKSINKGEAITRVQGHAIEKVSTIFHELNLQTSIKTKFHKKWIEEKATLKLNTKKLTLTRTFPSGKGFTCDYEAESK